ncbi:MAG TPA: hypothetical protein DCE43_05850 [Planctomycetaceae bacterium]|nr:hypothetical protein [Planctomycetaceae bacterium]|tara:strand:- start:31 stop:828 length:798 start_codon:yes stop_codon:yes gene_type:complete
MVAGEFAGIPLRPTGRVDYNPRRVLEPWSQFVLRSRFRRAWGSCLAVFLVAGIGCQVPLSRGQTPVGVDSSALLGTRYVRVSLSRLETGEPVLDELDDFITALNIDFNLPANEHIDVQGFLGNREASGEAFDPFFGPYAMTVGGWHFGLGVTGHAAPEEELDPYVFVSGQYLAMDVTYQDLVGIVVAEDDEFGWVAGGGIEWRPHRSVAVAPYIKYFDNGIFGEGTRVGGRVDTWLDRNWFLEFSGEAPISSSGHAIGLGLGFRY